MVSTHSASGDILFIRSPQGPLSPNDALVLAAWIVSLAEPNANHTFEQVKEAVQNT
jgi:hypothetical protein